MNFKVSGLDDTSNKVSNLTEREQELKLQMDELGKALYNTPKGEQYDNILRKISELNREFQGLPPKVEKVSQQLNTDINTPQMSAQPNIQTNVQPSSQSLSFWDTLKAKIQQIKPQIQQAQNLFKNMNIGSGTSKQLDLIKYKISEIEEKLEKAKNGEIRLKTVDGKKAEAELERLNNQKQKLEGNGSRGNMFSTIFSSLKRITPQMNNVQGIAVKVRNTIKGWGGGIRQGIRQIAKYATALFGLRSIYSTLSSCASGWLSSQNTGAQQLSANIEYMKYAMRKCVSSSYSIYNKSSLSINERHSKCDLCII